MFSRDIGSTSAGKASSGSWLSNLIDSYASDYTDPVTRDGKTSISQSPSRAASGGSSLPGVTVSSSTGAGQTQLLNNIDFSNLGNALLQYGTSGIKAEQDAAAAANAFSEHMWDKTAAWNSSQSEKDRLFQQASADKAMNWEAEQAALLRSWQEGQTQKEFDFNSAEAAKDRAFQAEQAKTAMDFSERMSNTAYQRAVSDLRAAGLNPILAVSNGAASSPSGVTSSGASASGSAGSGAFGSGRSASGSRASMSVPNSAKAAVSSVLSAGLSAAASKYATDIASKDKNRAVDVQLASTALQGLLSIGSAVMSSLIPHTSFTYRG